MIAYISVSFKKRAALSPEIDTIHQVLTDLQITPLVFVDRHRFEPAQEKQMMAQAMQDIDQCDLLIAETSDKAIGIGIEAGYARAKGKPVIYLRKADTAHSTTLSGISDHTVVYNSIQDLDAQLRVIIGVIGTGVPAL